MEHKIIQKEITDTGGSSGVAGVATPPLNFQKKIVVTRVAVVIDLPAWPLW